MIATTRLFITPDQDEARLVLEGTLAPLLDRDPGELAAHLPVGTVEHCIAVLNAYSNAGAHQMLVWPIRDPIRQIQLFAEQVCPTIRRSAGSPPP